MNCFFVSDLHGSVRRYDALFKAVSDRLPDALFLGGDLLPSGLVAVDSSDEDFISKNLFFGFEDLRRRLKDRYPHVFLIMGNDDWRAEEERFRVSNGLWTYIHGRKSLLGDYTVYGYSYVPPTPFRLKDWERYDVSRYVDPGCIPPEQGFRTVPREENHVLYSTIAEDLKHLTQGDDLRKAIMLFHSPPYDTCLDRAALDGLSVDSVPMDVHVGSIAIRRFIETRGPALTLHGHIHESARITGAWRDILGKTHIFTAAHDGPELAIVEFDPAALERASRTLF